jgi:hypothetical protein
MIKKFRETSSLLEKNRNRQKSVLTPEILQNIQTAIPRSPHTFWRKLSAQTGISLGLTHTAVRKMLKLYPYRMQVFHKIIPGDYAKRFNYCRWFKNLIRGNIGVLDQVFFTDEAWFHLSGHVNSQNHRKWRNKNPNNYTETAFNPQKICMWCAISERRIIGPLFFETTINGQAYHELIQQFIALLQVDECNCWFQQDSTTAHTAATTMEILHKFSCVNVISKGIGHQDPPDLTSPDFFLWSYLKASVYRRNPRDLKQLKMNITRAIEEVNETTLRKVARNMVKRVDKCIEINGYHFKHLL